MTTKNKQPNLQNRLLKSFFIQLGIISLMVMVGVFSAKVMVEDVLMRKALEGEAAHFWNLYRESEAPVQSPNTLNLLGYLAEGYDTQNVPDTFVKLEAGFQRAAYKDRMPMVYVDDQPEGRLYLIFDDKNVSRLTFLFGILPLTMVLICFYIIAWFTYQQSHRAISPVIQLAKRVEDAKLLEGEWRIDTEDLGTSMDTEVMSLVDAINHFAKRLDTFIERERNFTRDASHELRTPIAVLKSSLEVIERKYGDSAGKTLSRMHRTLHDMESLIETLLLVAREDSEEKPLDSIFLNDVVLDEIDALSSVYQNKPVSIDIQEDNIIEIHAPERVLRILVSNLLRNAYKYTPNGAINISLHKNNLVVADSGVGMDKEQLDKVFEKGYRGGQLPEVAGHGLGLAIVKRLANRYGWRISISSKVGEGTSVQISFKEARVR